MINEQELQEAVDKLWEGDDNGLLVKQDEVYDYMSEQNYNPDASGFRAFFNEVARLLLIEAYEQEQVEKYLRDQEYSQTGL